MPPTQLGPYTILSRLGRGGMGAVYEAIDTATGDCVAVKILASHLADDASLRKRFHTEIETLKSLRHPSIVQLLSFGEQDGQPYFAMELVRGKSLEQILRSGRRFTWQETVNAALVISRALKMAHDHGVVHRDLKPANLLWPDALPATETGSVVNAVKLADFGIAKLFGGAMHTAHGNIVGTAEYMAPEQAAGKPIDHRVDLYALGLVMFAMLTGRPPFQGTQLSDVLEKQRCEPPRRVASLVPNIPPQLDELINRLLAKDPASRPVSALALSRLLMAIELVMESTPLAADEVADLPENRGFPANPTAGFISGQMPATNAAADRKPTGAAAEEHPAAASPEVFIDLLAPTREIVPAASGTSGALHNVGKTEPFTGRQPPPADPSMHNPAGQLRTEKVAGQPTRLPTDVAAAKTYVERVPTDRFTTVVDLERAAQKKTQRDRLRQQRLKMGTACCIVVILVGGSYLLFKPLTADQLYDRIQAIARNDSVDLRDARPAINLFLERHPRDLRAPEIQRLDQTLDLNALEKRVRRRVSSSKPLDPIERDYRAAMSRETESPSACAAALEALLTLYALPENALRSDSAESKGVDKQVWLALVLRQAARLKPLAVQEQLEDVRRAAEMLAEADVLAAAAARDTDKEEAGKLDERRKALLCSVIETYSSRAHAADIVDAARRQLAEFE